MRFGPRGRGLRVVPVAIGVLVLLLGMVLVVLDASRPEGLTWLGQHAWTSQMLSNVIVVLATYLIIDRFVIAREKARWREVSWNCVESFADALSSFLSATEIDWLSDPRPVFPISEQYLESCLDAVISLEDAASGLLAIASANPESATFIDYVSEVRRTLNAWREAAAEELVPDDKSWATLPPLEKRRRFHVSRFVFVDCLLACYGRLAEDVNEYLRGCYLESVVFEGVARDTLTHAYDSAWDPDEWDIAGSPLKAKAWRAYWSEGRNIVLLPGIKQVRLGDEDSSYSKT